MRKHLATTLGLMALVALYILSAALFGVMQNYLGCGRITKLGIVAVDFILTVHVLAAAMDEVFVIDTVGLIKASVSGWRRDKALRSDDEPVS